MSQKIELNSYDLSIKTLPDGAQVVQIHPRIAFDEKFISDCKEMGVKEYEPR